MSEPLPERVILRSNPLEAVFLLVAVGALGFLIVTRIPLDVSGPIDGKGLRWGVGLAFVFAGSFGAAGSLRRLTLDREGFVEDNLYRSRGFTWRDCATFRVTSSGSRLQVLFVQTETPSGRVRLRSRYGRRLDDLVAVMNRFRARAMGEDG